MNEEKCPVCGASHKLPSAAPLGNGVTYFPLVECECGALLELASATRGETESGFIFRNVKKID